jgi:RimJ/RimL family protein N-acetyltransferase
MMTNWLKKTTLTGKNVELIPLQISHRDALLEASTDGELWELWFTSVPSENDIDKYIDFALTEQEKDWALPFTVVKKADNKIIGSTRFCNVESPNRRAEIGYTWYAKSFQRTGVNTECKYLLLKHAFETLEAIAVELRTHWHNHKSRSAIARIGAKQDGVLRNHMIDHNGLFRDTVVFSIIQSEWPVVKKSLEHKMNKYDR